MMVHEACALLSFLDIIHIYSKVLSFMRIKSKQNILKVVDFLVSKGDILPSLYVKNVAQNNFG